MPEVPQVHGQADTQTYTSGPSQLSLTVTSSINCLLNQGQTQKAGTNTAQSPSSCLHYLMRVSLVLCMGDMLDQNETEEIPD